MPRVSIITPIYNCRSYLPEAVESVLAQTYTDWELLLVDDGSQDGGDELARSYAGRHPDRIAYLEHEGHRNHGVSATRNLAVRHARGEYLALLDADDVWLPEKLRLQTASADAHPQVALVYGLAPRIDREGRVLTRIPPIGRGEPDRPADCFAPLLREDFIPASSVLLRRSCLPLGAPFEEGMRYQFEDWLLWSRLASRFPFLYLPAALTHYRCHAASAIERMTVHEFCEATVEWLRLLFRDELRCSPHRRTAYRYRARLFLSYSQDYVARGYTYYALKLLRLSLSLDATILASWGFHKGWLMSVLRYRGAHHKPPPGIADPYPEAPPPVPDPSTSCSIPGVIK